MEAIYFTAQSAASLLRCAPATVRKHVEPSSAYYTTSGQVQPLFDKASLEAARELIQGTPQHRGRVAPTAEGT